MAERAAASAAHRRVAWRAVDATAPRASQRAILALAMAGGVCALVTAVLAIRPAAAPPLSYDAYAVTLHFDRIVTGHRLEDVLGTTPKPLLTVAFGLAHAAGGWTAVAAVSIVAWAVSVALAVALTARLGGVAASVAAAVLLVASPTLLLESAWGLGTVWAIGLWSAAGMASLGRPPRWLLTGVLLGLASLVRVETLLVIALALVVVLGMRLTRGPRPGWHRRLAVGAGLWALPVMLLHDQLLTGDPLYWTKVSEAYGQALAAAGLLPTPAASLGMAWTVVVAAPVLALLAVGGAVVLVRDRAWPIVVGLGALGPGVAVALPVLAASGRLADARYLEPIRCTVVLLAALAIGWGADRVARVAWAPTSGLARRSPMTGVVALFSVVAALLATPAIGPLDASTQATLDRFRALTRTAEVAVPTLRGQVAATPGVAAWPGTTRVPGSSRRDLFEIPGNIRPRLALDLDLPLTRLAATSPASIDFANGQPPPGEVVVHSGGDLPDPAYRPFEAGTPVASGSDMLMPLLSDPASATWVVRVDVLGSSPLQEPTAR